MAIGIRARLSYEIKLFLLDDWWIVIDSRLYDAIRSLGGHQSDETRSLADRLDAMAEGFLALKDSYEKQVAESCNMFCRNVGRHKNAVEPAKGKT